MRSLKVHKGSERKAVRVEDDDADYMPMLQGIINTRCNYDGGKIEGTLEG